MNRGHDIGLWCLGKLNLSIGRFALLVSDLGRFGRGCRYSRRLWGLVSRFFGDRAYLDIVNDLDHAEVTG